MKLFLCMEYNVDSYSQATSRDNLYQNMDFTFPFIITRIITMGQKNLLEGMDINYNYKMVTNKLLRLVINLVFSDLAIHVPFLFSFHHQSVDCLDLEPITQVQFHIFTFIMDQQLRQLKPELVWNHLLQNLHCFQLVQSCHRNHHFLFYLLIREYYPHYFLQLLLKIDKNPFIFS